MTDEHYPCPVCLSTDCDGWCDDVVIIRDGELLVSGYWR